ncbi:uncharacterized protein LOC114074301 [Solanum pennellii]|uniref:Uncharacterized protein LOC114074301 n=1 Tax=Solanum pennellii TaxID=28526 RepID=A0ABM1UWU1_SOLPN|nr:uncharacterized protein LOC114074301 [Solanum pennellii]
MAKFFNFALCFLLIISVALDISQVNAQHRCTKILNPKGCVLSDCKKECFQKYNGNGLCSSGGTIGQYVYFEMANNNVTVTVAAPSQTAVPPMKSRKFSDCPGGGPCPGPVTGGDLGSVISNSMFDQMLKHRNENSCQGKNNFYNYNAFITAARSFPGFGTSGDINARKREIAAFFAQTSHETTEA